MNFTPLSQVIMALAITNCSVYFAWCYVCRYPPPPPPPAPFSPTCQDFYKSGLKGQIGWLRPWQLQDPPFYSLDFHWNIWFQARKVTRTFEEWALSPASNKWKRNKYPRDIVAFLLLAEWKYFQLGAGAIGRGRTVTLNRNTVKWLRRGLANAHTHTEKKKKQNKNSAVLHSFYVGN